MNIEGNKKITTDTRDFATKAAIIMREKGLGRAHEVYE
jgi:hypothetical protein